MTIQLNPEETVLFEGEVTLLKSKLNNLQTLVTITNRRLWVSEGNVTVSKSGISSVTEGKHGFAAKLVIELKNGQSFTMLAPRQEQLKVAALVLMGQATAEQIPGAPALTKVKNKMAWVAATGPIWAGLIAAVIGTMFYGDPDSWRNTQFISVIFLKIGLIYLFLQLDYLSLQQQGYNPHALSVKHPSTFPVYLFSRAKAFGHGKGYAITWCVLVVLDILLLLAD